MANRYHGTIYTGGRYQSIACNINVRVFGSDNWDFALSFRDYLNKHKQVAIAYEQIKMRLAVAGVDKQAYCYIKDPVCDLIYHAINEDDREK